MTSCDFIYIRPIQEKELAKFVLKQNYKSNIHDQYYNIYYKEEERCNRKPLRNSNKCELHKNKNIIENDPMFPFFVKWMNNQNVDWSILSYLLQKELFRIYKRNINEMKEIRKVFYLEKTNSNSNEKKCIELTEEEFATIYFGLNLIDDKQQQNQNQQNQQNQKEKETINNKNKNRNILKATLKFNRKMLAKYYNLMFVTVDKILENMNRNDILTRMR